jgi:AcrR family transcriptional regulator
MTPESKPMPPAGTLVRKRGPSAGKTAQTRLRICDAALNIFVQKGFGNTKMSEIAAAAVVAKGTLYLYFPTKEALFEAVLIDIVASTIRMASSPVLNADMSVQQILRQMLEHAGALLSDPRRQALFRLIVTEGPRFPEIIAVYRRVAFDPLTAAIKVLAETAVRRGEIKSDALVRRPLLFLSPAILTTIWNGMFPAESIDIQLVFEDFLDLVFGVSSHPDKQS